MADAQRDFWPDIAVQGPATTPLSILKEQAAVLARKTNGLLEGHVDDITGGSREFRYIFKIMAPTLDNYSYELFRVRHGVLRYPVRIEGQLQDTELKTEQEFVDALKHVLSSDETIRVISALLAQVKA
jgi:hypothetical protein